MFLYCSFNHKLFKSPKNIIKNQNGCDLPIIMPYPYASFYAEYNNE